MAAASLWQALTQRLELSVVGLQCRQVSNNWMFGVGFLWVFCHPFTRPRDETLGRVCSYIEPKGGDPFRGEHMMIALRCCNLGFIHEHRDKYISPSGAPNKRMSSPCYWLLSYLIESLGPVALAHLRANIVVQMNQREPYAKIISNKAQTT